MTPIEDRREPAGPRPLATFLEDSAWGTSIGLALAVVPAGLDGLAGARGRVMDEPIRR